MEIQQLRTFCTVARLLSFKQAAERLNYAQSSISAQIHALEEDLGVRLFDRLGRHILLTEAGDRLLQYAERILDLTEETRAEVASTSEPQGTLTIRVPETFCAHRLPPVILKFQTIFPKVRLRFITCAVEGLQKDLRKGITDLAFLITESIQASDLGVEALGFESVVIVSHPDHPLASKSIVQTKDLEAETVLHSNVDCSYRKSFQQLLDHENVRLARSIEFSSVAALKQCAIRGVGIAILPEVTVEEEIARGRLSVLPWSQGKLEMALLMIWYKDRWLSPSLSAFMNMTREAMNGNPPAGRLGRA
ncbi:MAG: LysR family transcriptional regulator [Desulfobacteraceae bacterium]|nr:MAG: LysR family transcriptional regulator [Desulfobacteraceae bacterium]